MAKKRVEAVVDYQPDAMVLASVATTESMIVLSRPDAPDEHYTYPPDGRFHVTAHDPQSSRSFFAPGPAYSNMTYFPLARIEVPSGPPAGGRQYRPSSAQSMTMTPSSDRPGILEIGILGQQAPAAVRQSLESQGAQVGLYQGPRSDTTIVLRFLP
jgi:hypothetical protein